jgi:P-type Mg2+ transporter
MVSAICLPAVGGIILPFSPAANFLGFVPLPLDFFLFLTLLTVTYLLVVQVAKRRLMRRWLGE